VNLDQPWCCLFLGIPFNSSILFLGNLIKAQSKNGAPDILESHRPTPPTATAALVEDPGRNTGEDGPPSHSFKSGADQEPVGENDSRTRNQ